MEENWEGCTTAEEVLQKLKSVGINMKSVTSLLVNRVLMTDLLATCNGVDITAVYSTESVILILGQETLLHMAARTSDVAVLLAVVQAYKKMGCLATALATPNGKRGALPVHIAASHCNYENTVLLLKECKEHSPESLTATMSGIKVL